MKEKLLKEILKKDPKAFGNINIDEKGNSFYVTGNLYTSLENLDQIVSDFIRSKNKNALVFYSVETPKSNLSVSHSKNKKVSSISKNEATLDEVNVVYYGWMNVDEIKTTEKYKKLNFETIEKVRACVDVVGFISPIVIDSAGNVIDGNLRLEVARRSGINKVLVVIVDGDQRKIDFLTLVLNRSSEFQRWDYFTVDEYVDSIPQLQPLLEPLGFFGEKILPTTFFGNTVIEYRIDEFNSQMQEYSQDIGLAEWAEYQRNLIKKEHERKVEIKNSKKPATSNLVSLFDLEPSEDDFIETHDANKVIQEHVDEMEKVADTITNNYDEKMKAIKEKRGQAWQTSRRTSKKKAADLRAEAEELKLLESEELLDVFQDDETDDEVIDD